GHMITSSCPVDEREDERSTSPRGGLDEGRRRVRSSIGVHRPAGVAGGVDSRDHRPSMAGEGAPIRIEGLAHRYGSVHAVRRIDLEIERGELVGLLGPNGAGKTTTLSMLATLLAPSRGD